MKITWDDTAPVRFLIYFGIRHNCLEIQKEAAKRLKYRMVNIDDISRKNYAIFESKLREHSEQIDWGLPVGTFFCRYEGGKWFLKDGNHRYFNLVVKGVTEFRIAYDPKDFGGRT